MQPIPVVPTGFCREDHDHRACVRRALAAAEELCRRRGQRLTPLRRRVLELVWSSHRPAGAYAILEGLRAGSHRAAPPSVYRALDFLQAQGLVHRLESLNAYAGCARPGRPHAGQFLVCTGCGHLAELDAPALREALAECARGMDFEIRQPTVEVHGLCPGCRGGRP